MPTFTYVTAGAFVAAYLLGSLSAAIITCKLMHLPDPRTTGSRNPGTTNVLRSGGKKAAAITLLGDMLKGLLAVVAVRYAGGDGTAVAAAGLAAFLGHLYPVYFRFQGGKGMATALGVLLGLSWICGLLAIATWLAVSLSFRISSLAALITFSLAPLYLWLLGGDEIQIIVVIVMALLLFWRHRKNIRNLLAGTEPRIGENKTG
jgi:glycerol-3-phosphate acyltransferase PlsY